MSHSPKSPGSPDPRLSPEEHENLSAYLDHELDDAGAEAVTAALSRRPEVRHEAESLRKTWEMLDYLPRPQAPRSFTEQTLTRLNSTKGILLQQGAKWRRYAIAGWAACIAVAALFGFWLTYSVNKEPEIVEVHAPVSDVLPTMERNTVDTVVPTSTSPEPKLPRKDIKQLQRSQLEISQQRNERLSREIRKVLGELRKKTTSEEKDRLFELSHKGGLPYMAEVISLAQKYNIPLIDPNPDSNPPPGKNKKAAAKNNGAGE